MDGEEAVSPLLAVFVREPARFDMLRWGVGWRGGEDWWLGLELEFIGVRMDFRGRQRTLTLLYPENFWPICGDGISEMGVGI